MNGFSTIDGFVEITQSLAEMIKYIANEPSVGLLYVQKHTQDAVPNVLILSNRIAEKSQDSSLHSEDLEDSITTVRSMKECGFPIVDEMIKDIASSLTLISAAKQIKRGLMDGLDLSSRMRRTRSWGPISWGYSSDTSEDVQQDGSNYFSSISKKASSFKWQQLESKEPIETEPQKPVRCPAPPVPVASASTGSIPDIVAREKASHFKWPQLESKESIETQPHTGQVLEDKLYEEEEKVETDDDVKLSGPRLLFVSENYDHLKVDKECRLEQWSSN